MYVLVLTGGVACGKSTVCGLLINLLSKVHPRYFSCDEYVGDLLTDPEILGKLSDVAGDQVFNPEGGLNREWFRDSMFLDSSLRKKVEGILHPLVLLRANEFVRESENLSNLVVIEVPLLYEVDFPLERDRVIVVGASERTQIQRLIEKRNIDQKTALGILRAQVPIQEKINRSDWVIWNDGRLEALEDQMKLLAAQLERKI